MQRYSFEKKNNWTLLNNSFELKDFEKVDRIEERGGGEKRLESDLNVEPDDEAEQFYKVDFKFSDVS